MIKFWHLLNILKEVKEHPNPQPNTPIGPAWVEIEEDEELRTGEPCPKSNQYRQTPRNRWTHNKGARPRG